MKLKLMTDCESLSELELKAEDGVRGNEAHGTGSRSFRQGRSSHRTRASKASNDDLRADDGRS